MLNSSVNVNHFNYTLKCDKQFNILYININSLRNKLEDLEHLIGNFSNDNITIHFLALCEVRIDDNECMFFNLPNYSAHFCCKQKNSGGVALFCHSSLPSVTVNRLSIVDIDFLCVRIVQLNLKICVIYKNPTVSMSVFLPIFDSILEKDNRCNIIGDFNINLLSNDAAPYINAIHVNSFYLLNKIDNSMCTRVALRNGVTSATIIDHVITDIINFSYGLSIDDTTLSDHKAIMLSFDSLNNVIHMSQSGQRSITKTDHVRLRRLLSKTHVSMNNIANAQDVSTCIIELRNQIDSCTSTEQIAVPNPGKPWITHELLHLFKERDSYFRLTKKYPLSNYIKDKHKFFKLAAEKKRKWARNNYFANLIRSNLGKPREIWKTFNYILHNKHPSNNIDVITNSLGIPLTDELSMANELNAHFSNVGASLSNRLLIENNFQYTLYGTL